MARTKYRALHDAVAASASRRAELERECAANETELERVRAAASAQSADSAPAPTRELTAEEEAAIDQMVDDARVAEEEADLAEERERRLNAEVYELAKARDERRAKLRAIDDEHAALLAPQVSALRGEIIALRDEKQRDAIKLDDLVRQRDEHAAALAEAERDAEELALERLRAEESVSEYDGVPEKTAKGNLVLRDALAMLKKSDSASAERLKAEDEKEATRAEKMRVATETHAATARTLHAARDATEEKERRADDFAKGVEAAGLEHDRLSADEAALMIARRDADDAKGAALESLKRETKAKDAALRKLRKAELALEREKEQRPAMETRRDELALDLGEIERERRAIAEATRVARSDGESAREAYLREERVGSERAVLFRGAYAEVKELEREIVELKREELVRARTIAELRGATGQAARRLAAKKKRADEQTAEVSSRDARIRDLEKRVAAVLARVREFADLHDLVKEQRNEFVALVTQSGRSVAELRDKLKILANEIDVLRGEGGEKERELVAARRTHAASRSSRDGVRAELNKAKAVFRERRAEVDEQISRVDGLCDVVDRAEKETLRMKTAYELAVERRNRVGLALVDRNDELCVLYEKLNVQEEVRSRGEIELAARCDEIATMARELASAERSAEQTRRFASDVPALDEQIARLKSELLAARRETARLSAEAETPGVSASRWRALDGRAPDEDELRARLEAIERRFSKKEEELAVKELVHEEATHLANQLRVRAAEGRAHALELARRVADVQAKTRATTRSLEATTAELAMVRAAAYALEDERDRLEDANAEARENLERGDAPDDDADAEWARRARWDDAREAAQSRARAEEEEGGGSSAFSAAEPRPNAYIPTDATSMGVPRPYGGNAPFKPNAPGANMRHFRPPEPREVDVA